MNADKTVMIIELDNKLREELRQRTLSLGYKVVAIGDNLKEILATIDAHRELAPDIVLFDVQVTMQYNEEITEDLICRYGLQTTPIILLVPRAHNLCDGLCVQAQDFIIMGQWDRDMEEYVEIFKMEKNNSPKLWANITDQALEEKLNHWIALSQNGSQPYRDLLNKLSAQIPLRPIQEIIDEEVPCGLPVTHLQAVHDYAESLLSVTDWVELRKAIVGLARGLGINISIASHDNKHRLSSQPDWFGHFETEWLYYEINQSYFQPCTRHLCTALMDLSENISILYSPNNVAAFLEVYWKVVLKLITSMTQLAVDKLRSSRVAV